MSFKIENFKKVMDAIRANPRAWMQEVWHGVEDEALDGSVRYRNTEQGECGTVHCVAGWAQMLAGHEQDCARASRHATQWLGLDPFHSAWLFSPHRTFQDLEAVEQGWRDPNNGNYILQEGPR